MIAFPASPVWSFSLSSKGLFLARCFVPVALWSAEEWLLPQPISFTFHFPAEESKPLWVFWSSRKDILFWDENIFLVSLGEQSSPRHSSHPRTRFLLGSQKCSEDLMQLCSLKVRSCLLENSPLVLMIPRSDHMYLLTLVELFSQMLIFLTLEMHTRSWS